MSIRIGDSCCLIISMITGKVCETRILTDNSTQWKEVSKYAIDNNIYLIVTPCINDGMGKPHIPSDSQWISLIKSTCNYLKSIGGNKNNCRLSIINEPMKFLTKEQYINFISKAYPIIKGYGFLTGAGNEEFITAQARGDMYPYILQNAQFDILDIHIQGSCDTPTKTEYWCNVAKQWATQYNKPLDCTEAFYSDIATSGGWTLLQSQMSNAERIGCSNFCNVFNNLDKSAFMVDTKSWTKLCFKINGTIRSNYWGHWKILMDTKHPIPNVPNIIEEDDMELNYVKSGTINDETKTVQEILLDSGYVLTITGKCDDNTVKAIKEFQTDYGLKPDAWVGKLTWAKLLSECATGVLRFLQLLTKKASYK